MTKRCSILRNKSGNALALLKFQEDVVHKLCPSKVPFGRVGFTDIYKYRKRNSISIHKPFIRCSAACKMDTAEVTPNSYCSSGNVTFRKFDQTDSHRRQINVVTAKFRQVSNFIGVAY
ncbi:hypothetical protein AHF37_05172 [Paragonimus kellicotti]|nr:hypothetical protein AHF37_05172 [Paragonimus kellicotti]